MMITLILIIHLIACFFLIFIVLIQSGKGAELGAAFGGSSQTLFGARGAATFFSKMTTAAAIIFMLTSLSLAVMTSKGGSVVKKTPIASEQKNNIPAGPAGPVQGVQPIQQQKTPAAPVVPSK